MEKSAKQKIEKFIEECKWVIKTFEENAKKFTEELVKHPSYTLTWSNQLFFLAAKHDLCKRWKEFDIYSPDINESTEEIWEGIKQEFAREFKCAARNCHNRSTSPTSNLIDDCKITALAELNEFIEQLDR
jgi:hypothetical protein